MIAYLIAHERVILKTYILGISNRPEALELGETSKVREVEIRSESSDLPTIVDSSITAII
jgi:hypothetical protein